MRLGVSRLVQKKEIDIKGAFGLVTGLRVVSAQRKKRKKKKGVRLVCIV